MFWKLDSPDDSKYWAEDDPKNENLGPLIVCPRDPDHRWCAIRPDLHYVLPAPRYVQDIVWPAVGDCLLHRHVVDLFEKEKLTGFDAIPVTVRYADGQKPPPSFWRLRTLGWGGVAGEDTGVRFIEKCEGCHKFIYSSLRRGTSLIPPPAWDGSDFFFVWPYPNYTFVTERVLEVIKRGNLTGVQFVDPGRITTSPAFSDRYPHRVKGISHYLPEPRAREIGEPLGIWAPPQFDHPTAGHQ